ncbi:hypothetical protein CERZMDRAFT_103619 [Cercospora zeae-maydis SCOH1-5]|uniref:F-box domain-containing protein n=1 Tax=Cercospora zeae-maydis SCOH1-5 TaxID=717836 RepID=A0A6A6EZ71_9PEZI|nr:hypothetical protein CERZMDRAFT_103619 [Cercospora zeae-maydis SCOH1-5]
MTNSEKRRKRKAARQEPSKPPAKQPKFKAHFVKMLAAELQLAILSYLPVNDIQKCRRVNQYMRDLIDDPPNQVICAEPCVVQGRAKFDEFIKTNIEYDVDAVDADGNPCAFLGALVSMTRSRGIAGDICFLHSDWPKAFAKHWLKQRHARAQSNVQLGCPDEYYPAVCIVVTKLHMLYMLRQGLSVQHPAFQRINLAEESIREDSALELVGVTREQCDAALLEKVAAGAFKGTRVHETCRSLHCQGDVFPYAFKLVGLVSRLDQACHTSIRLSARFSRLREALRSGRSYDDFCKEESAAAERQRQWEEASWTVVSRKARGGASKEAREHASNREAVQDNTIEAGGHTAEQAVTVQTPLPIMAAGSTGNTLSPPLRPRFPSKEEDEVGQKLLEVFELPKLAEDLPFAYYGRSRRMVHLLKEVLEGEKELTPLRKAAILDSIHIW